MALFGLMLISPLSAYAASEKEELVIGIFPRWSAMVTQKIFPPLAAYLEKELGRSVIVETSKDFPSFWQNVLNNRYDIVHYNQLHYLMAKKRLGHELIGSNEEFGDSDVIAALFVRKDSGLVTIADLRGKKVVFGGGRLAMISHLAVKKMLMDNGVMPGDYSEEYAKSPALAIMAPFYRRADAGGSGKVGLKQPFVRRSIDTAQIQVLAEAAPLKHVPWAMRSSLSPELKALIKKTMLEMGARPRGLKVLRRMNLSNILPVKDSDYDPHRRIAKAVLNEEY